MNKLFIIGLPRTGTTSLSVALLDYSFKVAHPAYTKRAFELADVISDAPTFCDFRQLDGLFPGSKFVYLERSLALWVPSMRMLLNKISQSRFIPVGIPAGDEENMSLPGSHAACLVIAEHKFLPWNQSHSPRCN